MAFDTGDPTAPPRADRTRLAAQPFALPAAPPLADPAAPPLADPTTPPLAEPARLAALHRTCLGATSDEVFDRFARLVRDLLDVPVALVSLVADDHQFFPGQAGLPEPWAGKRETPLSHSFCQYVVVEGRPKIYPDARVYAQVRDNLAIPDLGVVAYAGMPLTDLDGRVLGSLCAIDSQPRAWTSTELSALADLAAACSSELRLRLALDAAEEARRHAEILHAQMAMLAELTETLAGTLDIDDALRRLAGAVTPRLADWCVITLAGRSASPRQVAAAHRDPTLTADVARFAELLTTDLGEHSVTLRVLRTGQPVLATHAHPDDITERTVRPEMAQMAARLGYASHLTVPITGPGQQRRLGTLTLVNGPRRPAFTEADLRTAVDIGRRAGLAVDNSRMYGEQRHVAEVLQHSMLPDLPEIDFLELHARYRPTASGAQIGGDWYDAFVQPDGDVVVAVGDVSGHDIEAAATMGQLRNLVRGDAYGRDDAAGELLAQLDRAVHGLAMHTSATAVLARIRRAGDAYTVSWSNAGHPPPALLYPDGSVEVLWTPPEPLLGLPYPLVRSTHERTVPAGATLVLYTDGLVENPPHLIDAGIARLVRTLTANAALPVDKLCALLVGEAPSHRDDIALLLIRLTAPA